MLNSKIVFHRKCNGRNEDGKKVFEKAIDIQVVFCTYKENDKSILNKVNCTYIAGGHNQRCKASHPKVDKLGKGVLCPYAVDLPLENISG